MTFQKQSKTRDDKVKEKSKAVEEVDASIVAFSPEVTLIDDRWVIILDPRAIDRNDIAIRLTAADLAGEDDDNQDGEEG
ncbi:MAG: hypothetical protein AAF546_06855 [Verrucomicrobiota bacterium]